MAHGLAGCFGALFLTHMKDFMKNLYNGIRTFAQDEEGATAVEYGVMVGLIAVAIIVTVGTIGTNLNTLFLKVKDCVATPKGALCV